MPGSASPRKNLPETDRTEELAETYVFAGRFEYEFDAPRRTTSGSGAYLIVLKADGTVLIHDGMGYEPVAWLTRPTEVRLNETGVPLLVATDTGRVSSEMETETLTVRPVTPVVPFDARVPRDLPLTRGAMVEQLREQATAVEQSVETLRDGLEAGWPTDDMVERAARAVDELYDLLRDVQRSK